HSFTKTLLGDTAQEKNRMVLLPGIILVFFASSGVIACPAKQPWPKSGMDFIPPNINQEFQLQNSPLLNKIIAQFQSQNNPLLQGLLPQQPPLLQDEQQG
ncbi:unnamed protein product, partial [Meganyctiphanes norvegica]